MRQTGDQAATMSTAMRLGNQALTHYPHEEVREVLAFWNMKDG
jgi:hypothetical protein